jgi:hypothetical protein
MKRAFRTGYRRADGRQRAGRLAVHGEPRLLRTRACQRHHAP